MIIFKLLVAAIALFAAILRSNDSRRAYRSGDREGGARKAMFALAFGLITVTVLLDIPQVYDTVDSFLGNQNYANVLMRFAVYGLFLILGVTTARAFDSMLALWLIKGTPGIVAVTTAAVITLVMHMLGAYSEGSSYATPAGWVYSLVWQAYLAYVSIALLSALLPAAFMPGDRLRRASAALSAGGYLIITSYPVVRVASVIYSFDSIYTDLMKMVSMLLIVAGAMLVWIVNRIQTKQDKQSMIQNDAR